MRFQQTPRNLEGNNMADLSLDLLIHRQPVYTEAELERGVRMVYDAQDEVLKTYQQGGKTLALHIPQEDLPYQESHGGTYRDPVLVSLFSSNNEPIRAMPTHDLPCFSYLQAIVVPLFTSQARLAAFVEILQDNLFVIPETSELSAIRLSPTIEKMIAGGGIVINPLPEIFMGRFPYYNPVEKSLSYVTGSF